MKLYNTLTRKKEEFVPIKENEVSIYVCGPTVYNYIHVGNARPMIVFDTMRRYFKYRGYKVNYVSNFTDIDDKLIIKAQEQDTTVKALADHYIDEYLIDSSNLNVKDDEIMHPKATETIEEMVEFISELENDGYAYAVDGNVYFDVTRIEDYGKLSKKNIEDLVAGARIVVNEDKKNPMDFLLWKAAKPGEPYWESPWGHGRPGWHIECSVMAKKHLGETIDIHAGGDDLQFPHHENEIAQSECHNGKPFANYWMHNAMINANNIKMSKSKKNFFTVRAISEEFDLEILRLYLLSSHYRKPINFSREIFLQSKSAYERLVNGKKLMEEHLEKAENRELNDSEIKIKESLSVYKDRFISSLEDDFNTAEAISIMFDLVKLSNINFDKDTAAELIKETLGLYMEMADVLAILQRKDEVLEDEIQNLIEERISARKNKNFARADEIRDSLKARGIELLDSRDGTTWRRI
ncbi:MAG: cysteine--tRNA ligase [Tissierellales bacterium]|jgi:cysteinyl-tRNA synthetase|nr:cysteine--tRNA ligase [Tissierellales bacterium]